MKSEDIARYVTGLEGEVERLRAELPVLPDVGPVERRSGGLLSISDGRGDDYRWHPEAIDRHEASALEELAVVRAARAFLDAEAAAVDTTPDTSRVTFGARDEGTGMVLLQHADMGHSSWGLHELHTADWHRQMVHHRNIAHPAHAALAEVREALDTAEAAGVDVDTVVWCDAVLPAGNSEALSRARRYLVREVQALVDQGLRGDDLNARVPYRVTDHRAPVEAAESSGDDGPDADELLAARLKDEYLNGPDIGRWVRVAQLARSEFRRAARTSEENQK